ncbi:TetR family multidrug efflux transcriptional regulator VceR [Sphingomonas daechungensis]|uniref:TetR/AcrR family transcriptional regulator n=1 Tax=Sphingomonas daechungensis TaxID=1176646 RepID=UPI001CB9AED0|nr:TetR/AcrR family transcriptional regulator [Sphingomonas daechungensis]
MRVRTEEKKREIVDVAAELFHEHGFERTSMSMIAERLGGSKATLYGYFQSKEQLLAAVLLYDVTDEADRLMNEFLSSGDLRDGLIKLGIAYMTRRLSPVPIANVRMVATQPADSPVGKEFFERVLGPAWDRLARRFALMMDEGLLKRADPWVVAMHWKGLNEWDMFEKRLLGAIDGPDPELLKKSSTLAAEAFLQLYGTDESRAGGSGS